VLVDAAGVESAFCSTFFSASFAAASTLVFTSAAFAFASAAAAAASFFTLVTADLTSAP